MQEGELRPSTDGCEFGSWLDMRAKMFIFEIILWTNMVVYDYMRSIDINDINFIVIISYIIQTVT